MSLAAVSRYTISARRNNLPIKSVCCVAVGLIDLNPSVQRFHVDRVKKYLDLCREFGADNLLLVLGEYIWEQQVIPPAEQWKTGVANVRAFWDELAFKPSYLTERPEGAGLREVVDHILGLVGKT